MTKNFLISIILAFMGTTYVNAQIYHYDDDNRLWKVEYDNNVTVEYGYDALGNRTSKKVSGSSAETYTITVNVSPSGSGSVTGGGTYAANSTVELRANANAGYAFSKWSNNKTDNPLSIKLTGDLTLTAYFTEKSSDLPGDIVVDGVINLQDLNALVNAYTSGTNATTVTDLDSDSKLTIADITRLISLMPGDQQGGGDDKPGTHNGHEYVDLGLPSGLLWATMNVGAETPESYGQFFAWGETTGYTSDTSDGRAFDFASYKWMNAGQTNSRQINKYQVADGQTKACWYDSNGTFIGDGKTKLDLADDAARANWGGQWTMPTSDNFTELIDNTTYEWTQVNNVDGMKFTSKNNGNSIFFPATGNRRNSSIYNQGTSAYYRSSSLNPTNTGNAYSLYISQSGTAEMTDPLRSLGLSVRPVVSKSAINK